MGVAGPISVPSAGAAVPGIQWQRQWWVLGALILLIGAILSRSLWVLNFAHVFSGLLWTGTDIFMGFILGPIMRQLDLPVRRALIVRLMPRMLFYMPTMSIVTSTSGWYLAQQFGFLDLPWPQRWWLVAAGVLVLIMTIQGFGILLPTNLRVYLELRKERPDGEKIARWMRTYVRVVAMQAVLQVLTILVMARLATGV
jgi:uncharacterized membrane protein